MDFTKSKNEFVFIKQTIDRYIVVKFNLMRNNVYVNLYVNKDENISFAYGHSPIAHFFKVLEYTEWLSYLEISTFANRSRKKQPKFVMDYYNDILKEAVKELYIYWGL